MYSCWGKEARMVKVVLANWLGMAAVSASRVMCRMSQTVRWLGEVIAIQREAWKMYCSYVNRLSQVIEMMFEFVCLYHSSHYWRTIACAYHGFDWLYSTSSILAWWVVKFNRVCSWRKMAKRMLSCDFGRSLRLHFGVVRTLNWINYCKNGDLV